MAYSYVNYTGNGTTSQFAVPFPFITRNDVHVYVQGLELTVDVQFTWLNDGMVQITTTPLLNEIVHINRQTNRDARLVDYQNGALLDEETLDLDSTQMFYLMQEAFDWVVKAKDEDNTIFMDRQSILDAITGWIDESMLASDLSSPMAYLLKQYGWDALFTEGDDVYEDDVFNTEVERVPGIPDRISAAEIIIDQVEASITNQVVQAEIDGETGDVSYSVGTTQLFTQQYFVKLDTNGNVAGFGLYNDGDDSEFIVNVDKFAIIKADGTGDTQKPFTVDTSTGNVAIDGNLLVTGSIAAEHIGADEVNATHIAVATLSAISVDCGTLTAGVVRSTNGNLVFDLDNAELTVNQADGIQITADGGISVDASGGIQVNSAAGIEVNNGGDIALHNNGSNYGMIRNVYNGSDHSYLYAYGSNLRLWPATDGDKNLDIGNSTHEWNEIDIEFDSSLSVTRSSSVKLSITGAYSRLVGPSGEVRCDADGVHDGNHTSTNLGTSSLAWDDVYGDDFNNVADIPWLDERTDVNGTVHEVDDIAVIKSIKPSATVNPRTGLRIINDSTLPPWLVVKHKKDHEVRNEDGERIQFTPAGSVAVGPDGKPYFSISTFIGLLMGAVRQLDDRLERIEHGTTD